MRESEIEEGIMKGGVEECIKEKEPDILLNSFLLDPPSFSVRVSQRAVSGLEPKARTMAENIIYQIYIILFYSRDVRNNRKSAAGQNDYFKPDL